LASTIVHVEAFPIQLSRDLAGSIGTAGTPNELSGSGIYRWSKDYPALYSTRIESALVKITLENEMVGWGEAQAPLAPEVACTIVERLLKPVLEGAQFAGTPEAVRSLWQTMYSTMRVRGQTGGFMLDAISGVDLALWDLAGKLAGKPVSELIAGSSAKKHVPAYLSGLSGDRLQTAVHFYGQGFRTFKLYYESDWPEILHLVDALRRHLTDIRVAVDALWHLDPLRAIDQARELDSRDALWLECPLMPEEIEAHIDLARSIRTPIALGESYRTTYELAAFFRGGAMRYVQPDLGRAGLTESIRIAREAARHGMAIVPHVSIAFGPQIAAAIHFAAATPNCNLCEYNPQILRVANRFLREPLQIEGATYLVPDRPGLGVDMIWPPSN
jgi:D-galactarolactone cycloisomerase